MAAAVVVSQILCQQTADVADVAQAVVILTLVQLAEMPAAQVEHQHIQIQQAAVVLGVDTPETNVVIQIRDTLDVMAVLVMQQQYTVQHMAQAAEAVQVF